MTTKLKPTGRGGPGRGQGRIPLPEGEVCINVSITVSPEALAEMDQLRRWLKKA